MCQVTFQGVEPFLNDSTKKIIQEIIHYPRDHPTICWKSYSMEKYWGVWILWSNSIHNSFDGTAEWAGVLYLTDHQATGIFT